MANGQTPFNGLEYDRQLGLVDVERLSSIPITVIGAGGIGSPSVLCLTKMGCRQVTVYDFDVVEAHNLPNQWYRKQDIGKPKVLALQEIVRDFSNIEITAVAERYVNQPLRGIVIVAVDSMKVRKEIWDLWKNRPRVRLFMEGRMGGEEFQLFCVRPCDPDHQRRYEAELYSDKDAVELPCTERAIIFNTLEIGAEVAHQVRNEAMAGVRPGIRPVDFLTIRMFRSGVLVAG